jgi:predicted RND superfamily exporter protein
VTTRARIESLFGRFALAVARHPWWTLALMLALTGGLGAQLPHIRVDNSDDAFLHPSDPERVRYDRFQAQFGTDDRITILVEPTAVFDIAFLERLREFHHAIESEIPYVDEVDSLLNARNTRGEEDELIVEELLEDWPANDAELALVRQRVLDNPLLAGTLVSHDEQLTVLQIRPFTYSTRGDDPSAEFGDNALAGFDEDEGGGAFEHPPYLTPEEGREMVIALNALRERFHAPDFQIYMVGGPIMEYTLNYTLQRDVSIFMPLSILVICVFLGVLFRRVSGVVLPLTVVLSSLVAAMGCMVLLDIPFSVTLNILPAFLVVVGVSDSVHVLVIAYQAVAAGRSREEAIVHALTHSGLAILMTSVTTAAGLASFTVAALQPVAHLGIIAPIGVLIAMLYSVVMLPALFVLWPMRMQPVSPADAALDSRNTLSARLLVRLADAVTSRPKTVLAVAGGVLLIGLPGLLRVQFSHDGMRWYPEDDPVRISAQLLDDHFHGTSSLELLVRTDRENGLHEPEVIQRIQAAMDHSLEQRVGGRDVSLVISITDVVKETHRALNENDPAFYTLPDDKLLIAQELLLFENSGTDDLEELTDTGFSMARVTIMTPWVDAMVFPPFLAELREQLEDVLGDSLTFELTGGSMIFTQIFRSVIITMARSYVLALLVIAPMLILLVGNLKRGVAAMIPNLIPVYLVLALMGWTGIPLDMSTLLIGGVLLGLAVDDTIHFMHKFNRYLEEYGDATRAVHETMATTGNALLFTSMILSCGFLVFCASYLNNTYWFGLLISFSAAVAFLADVTVAPALMVLLTRDERDE